MLDIKNLFQNYFVERGKSHDIATACGKSHDIGWMDDFEALI